MKIKYLGPRGKIKVLSGGKVADHKKGEVVDYDEAVATDLLADPSNRFTTDLQARPMADEISVNPDVARLNDRLREAVEEIKARGERTDALESEVKSAREGVDTFQQMISGRDETIAALQKELAEAKAALEAAVVEGEKKKK